MSTPIHVISLGAGVQSSCMALMATHGEITPFPQCAIFADTGWEPRAVYEWLDWLETKLTYPVVRVSCGRNIRDDMVNSRMKAEDYRQIANGRWATIPFFTSNPDGSVGKSGRQCTSEYKIVPIETYIKRNILGLVPHQRAPKEVCVVQWRGITTDEAARMKPSRDKWLEVRYPLALEHNMSRGDCLFWMEKHGYPKPPRSACIGCPYHSNAEWRDMKLHRPDEWADAVDFDARIRVCGGMRGDTFLHRSCKPLSEVDLSNDIDNGQMLLGQWGGECEGMCGV